MKTLMIDYKDHFHDRIVRCKVDDCSFCVRDGICYFTSNGSDYEIPIEDIFQVYPI